MKSILRKLLVYINKWSESFKKYEKPAIEMSKLKEYLEWELNTRENINSDFLDDANIKKNDVYYTVLFDQIKEKFPILPEPDPSFLASNTVVVSGSGSSVFQFMGAFNTNDSFDVNEEIIKIEKSLIGKRKLDDINERINNIKQKLLNIDQRLKEEFEESVSQYYLLQDQEGKKPEAHPVFLFQSYNFHYSN